MLDFASALYLGMRHSGTELQCWNALTLGRPAALQEPPGAVELAGALAGLVGTETATLLASTMHLFWDLMGMLADEQVVLLVDDGAYPIARWGAERAAALGVAVKRFERGSANAAARLARAAAVAGRRPVIVTDGWFPGPGVAPPLAAYAEIVGGLGGYLVVDDSQLLGLFGQQAGRFAPYGKGGGGSLRRHGLVGLPQVLVGASLAKAFGTPLAVLCGGAELVRSFEARSATRKHCSPPSVAVIRAGLRALALNRTIGDALRWRLWCRVSLFRARVRQLGLGLWGGCFPVQTIAPTPLLDGERLHTALRAAGVDTVLQRLRGQPAVTFLITTGHTVADIEQAGATLASSLRRASFLINPAGRVPLALAARS